MNICTNFLRTCFRFRIPYNIYTMNRQERRQQGDFFNHRTKKSGLIENDDGTVVYFESREKGAKAGITVKSIKPYIKIFKDKELAAK